jgi:hypothetical protein
MIYFYAYLIGAWSFVLGWFVAAIYLQTIAEAEKTRKPLMKKAPPRPDWQILSTDATASR